MKKVMILLLSVLLLVGCNPNENDPDPSRPGAVKLNGESNVTIEVGTQYIDAGAYVEGDTTIELNVVNNVDSSTVGEYVVTYSYQSNGVTISKSRTVIVEEQEDASVSCELNGSSTTTIMVGDTYDELGVTCTPHVAVSINDNINEDILGNYQVTYSYESLGVTETLTRNVVVEGDYAEGDFALLGLQNMTINQGDDWTDPGYNASGLNHRVVVSGTVDVNTPGTYTINYQFTLRDENDTTLSVEMYSREVVVVQMIFYEYDRYELAGLDLTVYIEGFNVSSKFTELSLELYQDDVFYDSYFVMDGDNIIPFMALEDGYTYTIRIKGVFYDGTTEVIEGALFATFDIQSIIVKPKVVLSNEVISHSSYTADYTIADDGNNYNWFSINFYDGTNIVDFVSASSSTSGSFVFDSLDEGKTYRIEVTIAYIDGEGNYTYIAIDKEIETLINFDVSVDVEQDSIFQDASNKLIIHVTNPNSYTIENVFIDGVDSLYNLYDSSTIHIDLDTSVLGTFNHKVDAITITVNGTSKTISFDESYSYTVVDEIQSTDIPYVTSYFSNDDDYDTSSNGSGHTMQLELYNPLQLTISNIYLDGVPLGSNYIYTNDGETITFYDNFGGEQRVTGFSYEFGGITYDVSVDSFNVEYIPYCGGTIHQVSTVQDVKDMVSSPYGCYTLMNDIDLSGENWAAVVGGAQNGDAKVFGNGYTISNLSIDISDVSSTTDSYWGLFRSLNGAYIENLTLDVDINVGNSNHGKTYIGAIAGYVNSSYFINVNVTGDISSNWHTDGSIASFVGMSVNSFYENIDVNTTMSVSQWTPVIESVISSMIAKSDTDEVHGYSVTTTLSITGVTSHDKLHVAEPIAIVSNSFLYIEPGN